MSEPSWWDRYSFEWEAEWVLHEADWVTESARIDADGERTRTEEVNDGGQSDAAAEAE